MKAFTIIISSLVAIFGMSGAASAEEFTVSMVNKDASGMVMQFEPAFLKVAPGDTVHFVSVDKGHNTESIANGVPDGAEGWRGKISQNLDVTLTVPGLYAFKCTPHLGMAMVGLIQVGDAPANADAIRALKLPSKAKGRLDALIEQ
jgi:pseudoazurin